MQKLRRILALLLVALLLGTAVGTAPLTAQESSDPAVEAAVQTAVASDFNVAVADVTVDNRALEHHWAFGTFTIPSPEVPETYYYVAVETEDGWQVVAQNDSYQFADLVNVAPEGLIDAATREQLLQPAQTPTIEDDTPENIETGTITLYPTMDIFVSNATSFGNRRHYVWGKDTTFVNTRTLIHFGNVSLPAGAYATSVRLRFWQYSTSICPPGSFYVARITGGWDNGTTWPGPSYEGDFGGSTHQCYSNGTAPQLKQDFALNTALVNDYLRNNNNGILLRNHDENAGGAIYCAGDNLDSFCTSGTRPQLIINWQINDPGVPTINTPTQDQVVTAIPFQISLTPGATNGRGSPIYHMRMTTTSNCPAGNGVAWQWPDSPSANISFDVNLADGTYYFCVRQGDSLGLWSPWTADRRFTINRQGDISVTKTAAPNPVFAGSNLTYTITVSNSGPSTATSVNLTDTLPSNVSYVSATPPQGVTCTQTGNQVTCPLGNMNVNTNRVVTLVVRVNDGATGNVVNTAAVTSTNDPNTGNNTATATTPIENRVDLEITKVCIPDPVVSGQNVTCTLTVRNIGGLNATGVSVTDTLPQGMTFVSADSAQGTCSHSNGLVACALSAMAPNATATIELVAAIVATNGGTITNTATVTATQTDRNTENNTASDEITVIPVADLSLTKTTTSQSVSEGASITFNLSVSNAGPASAENTQIVDTLPAGMNYSSSNASPGTCTHSNGVITCELGTLNANASATVTVIATIRQGATGTQTNTATVSSNASDPVESNNTASASVTVVTSTVTLSTISLRPNQSGVVRGEINCLIDSCNGFQIDMQFNPDAIQVNPPLIVGTFFGASPFATTPTIDNTAGWVRNYGIVSTDPNGIYTGAGLLFEMNVTMSAECIDTDITASNVIVTDRNANAITVTVSNGRVNCQPDEPPNITTQPQSQAITSGQTAALTVVATGTAPLHYQWYRGTAPDESAPVGTDSASFTTPALTETTSYWVRVSNASGSVNSETAIVTVTPTCTPPSITTQPQSQTINSGGTATLNVVATGTAPLHFQWYQGTAPTTTTPVGTDSASFTTPTLPQTTAYWVRVSNACSPPADSSTATITVGTGVALKLQPASVTVGIGEQFDVQIIVEAGAQSVNGVSAYLNFDASKLQVVSITPGTSLTTPLANTYNNTAGTIDFAAGQLAAPFPSGTFTVATVRLRATARTASTALMFNTATPRKSNVTWSGESVLGYTQDANVAVTGTVILAVMPAAINGAVGNNFSFTIEVRAGTQQVNGASAYLNFDPAKMRVVSVTPGAGLPNVLTNTYNNTAGTIDFAAGQLSGTLPSGTFTLATVQMQALASAASTPLTFNSTTPRVTNATFGGESVFKLAENGTVTIVDSTLTMALRLQGRTLAPNAAWIIPAHVVITPNGSATPVIDGTYTSSDSGVLPAIVGLSPGNYQYFAKGEHTLSCTAPIIIAAGANNFRIGPLPEGDANNDDIVDILDFSILATAFGKVIGQPGYDPRADFNQDGSIDILDFSLLATNFGRQGGACEVTTVAAPLPAVEATVSATPSVNLVVTPSEVTTAVDDSFDVHLDVVAGEQTVDGVQVRLNFDPTKLQVESITLGSSLPITLANTFDNTVGQIYLAVGSWTPPLPSGTFTVATIQFKALAAADVTPLNFGNGTNVSFAGESVLNTTSGATIHIQGTYTAPTPLAPSGTTDDTSPTFSWTGISPLAWYYLWVTGPNGYVMDQWYDGWNICANTACSVTPDLNLPGGNYTWWIQQWTAENLYSPWSSATNFTVDAPAQVAQPIAPVGTLAPTETQPEFSWIGTNGSAWYYLWIEGPSGHVLDQWYDGWNICVGGMCSIHPPLNLVGGSYRWWVQMWTPVGGYAAWSEQADFVLPIPPAAPTLTAPQGEVTTGAPTFEWMHVPAATWYYLWLSGPNGGVLDQWYDAYSICADGTCAMTPPLSLTSGTYQWWIQAWSPEGGYGAWSSPGSFSVVMPIMPGEAVEPLPEATPFVEAEATLEVLLPAPPQP